MRAWLGRALASLSVAVACARATDEDLIRSGDDASGGTSGSGTTTGGRGGIGGTPATGGSSARGGTATGGTSGSGAGKGGTGAASGTDAGGASDGGDGGSDPCGASTPSGLRVDFQRGGKPLTDEPDGGFHVVNGTSQPIALSELTVRYFFHSEFSCSDTVDRMAVNVVAFQFDNRYAAKDLADVEVSVVSQGTGAPECDAYFEFGFDAAAGPLASQQIAFVGFWTQIPIYDGTVHNQANDYSYGACTTAFVYWDKVGLYRSGRLVSGSEPGGGGGGAGGEGGAPGGGMGGV